MTLDTDLATLREQLRHLGPWRGAVGDEALDRVEAELARLQRENESLKRWQLAYAKGREGLVKQADQDLERAEAAEAKLARLREGLRQIIDRCENGRSARRLYDIREKARALLAEDGAA